MPCMMHVGGEQRVLCLFGQILKDRQRAADCNKRCIVLASAIYPIPNGAGWYRVSYPAFTHIVRDDRQRLLQIRTPSGFAAVLASNPVRLPVC